MDEYVRERLVEMRRVTPDGAMSLMDGYETACKGYFERGAEFMQLLFDAFMGQMFDQFMRDFRAEESERLPELEGEEPDCWRNATWIFKGETGGRYPFNGMLTIDLSVFRASYVYEGGGAEGPGSGGGVWRNDLLTGWMLGIELAKEREERDLNEVKEYALRRYEPWSPPLINEYIGWRRQIWGNRCYILMMATFIEKSWAWVFEVFEMSGSRPEFLMELAEDEDDS